MPDPSLKDLEKRRAPNRLGSLEELQFTVEQWSDDDARVEEVFARLGNLLIARMAFIEAVRQRPGKLIRLRQVSRVVCDSRRERDLHLDLKEALDAQVADAIAACDGDALAALRASLVATGYLEAEIERLTAALAGGLDARRSAASPRGRTDERSA